MVPALYCPFSKVTTYITCSPSRATRRAEPGTTGLPTTEARVTPDPNCPSSCPTRTCDPSVQSGPPKAAMVAPMLSYVLRNSSSSAKGITTSMEIKLSLSIASSAPTAPGERKSSRSEVTRFTTFLRFVVCNARLLSVYMFATTFRSSSILPAMACTCPTSSVSCLPWCWYWAWSQEKPRRYASTEVSFTRSGSASDPAISTYCLSTFRTTFSTWLPILFRSSAKDIRVSNVPTTRLGRSSWYTFPYDEGTPALMALIVFSGLPLLLGTVTSHIALVQRGRPRK
mmetsp:Transcript_21113/g.46894  ORF Transcript_21113/g.46894 Transcript_21113/m.46894 type:complete len:284 (-) Transcript_21113:15-866(-)